MDGIATCAMVCLILLIVLLIVLRVKLNNMVKAKVGYKMKVSKGEMSAIQKFVDESKTTILKLEDKLQQPTDCYALVSNELSLYWDDDGMLWHEVVPRVSFTDKHEEFVKHEGLELEAEKFVKLISNIDKRCQDATTKF